MTSEETGKRKREAQILTHRCDRDKNVDFLQIYQIIHFEKLLIAVAETCTVFLYISALVACSSQGTIKFLMEKNKHLNALAGLLHEKVLTSIWPLETFAVTWLTLCSGCSFLCFSHNNLVRFYENIMIFVKNGNMCMTQLKYGQEFDFRFHAGHEQRPLGFRVLCSRHTYFGL